jgi:hypothetical protein
MDAGVTIMPIDGDATGFTVIVMPALLTAVGEAQGRPLVSVQAITSPFWRAEVLNAALPEPTGRPFFVH